MEEPVSASLERHRETLGLVIAALATTAQARSFAIATTMQRCTEGRGAAAGSHRCGPGPGQTAATRAPGAWPAPAQPTPQPAPHREPAAPAQALQPTAASTPPPAETPPATAATASVPEQATPRTPKQPVPGAGQPAPQDAKSPSPADATADETADTAPAEPPEQLEQPLPLLAPDATIEDTGKVARPTPMSASGWSYCAPSLASATQRYWPANTTWAALWPPSAPLQRKEWPRCSDPTGTAHAPSPLCSRPAATMADADMSQMAAVPKQ